MKSRRELMFGAAGLGALLVATSAQARTMTASASPSSLEGAGWPPTDPTYVTVSGGTPPYSYEWVHIGGTGYVYPNDPAGESTTFYWDGPWGGPPKMSRWVCVVTDSASQTATTNTFTVTFDPTM